MIKTILSKRRFVTKAANITSDVHQRRFVMQNSEIFNFNSNLPLNKYLDLKNVSLHRLKDNTQIQSVPNLKHNLENILKQKGIVTNSHIDKIYQPKEIDTQNFSKYLKPSSDAKLIQEAIKLNLKYIMSTSTVSDILNQLYFLISNFRSPRFNTLSKQFEYQSNKFMISVRKPTIFYLQKINKQKVKFDQKNIYAINKGGQIQEKQNILMNLGKSMQVQLTTSSESFEDNFLKKSKDKKMECLMDYHRYIKVNDNICMRSQIDCKARNEKGQNYVFQIKTRATCPIRYDLKNYQSYFDYQLKKEKGLLESYEREYYDLIRSAFIKWAWQLYIGNMDGAFVAYHNTKRIFGYQYFKRQQIVNRIFGSNSEFEGNFLIGCKLLTEVIEFILDDLKVHDHNRMSFGFYSCGIMKRMDIYVDLEPQQQADDFSRGNLKNSIRAQTKQKMSLFKYQLRINKFINNVIIKQANILMQCDDKVQIRYSLQRKEHPPIYEYKKFLYESYCYSINLGDLKYGGVWF